MKFLGTLFLATLVAAVAPATASAQTATSASTVANPIVLRVGVLWPSDVTVRRWAGYTPINVGLDMETGQGKAAGSALAATYIDYFGGSTGPRVNVVGFGMSERVASPSEDGAAASGNQQFFTGGGAGAYNVSSSNGNGFVLGAKFFAGVDAGGQFITEFGYNLISAKNGINPSGFFMQMGLRL
ncbi:MAG: hypothetical protein P4L33_02050 [Capsulimonadaceae bacterium]|nr:hypothetical protein [Capsulimonadaceae bacterium]